MPGQTILIGYGGGFSVDNATLNRFLSFALSITIFLIAGWLSLMHLALLRIAGSNNPALFKLALR
jgi:ubiquinol-cytochrome c reductase cytochrome b subunit